MKELKLSTYNLDERFLGHYLTVDSSSVIIVHEELPVYVEYDTDVGMFRAWESLGSQYMISSDMGSSHEAEVSSMIFKLVKGE